MFEDEDFMLESLSPPPLLEDHFKLWQSRFAEDRHKLFHLEGNYQTFVDIYEYTMLVLYILQLGMTISVTYYFSSLGEIGAKFFNACLAMIAWQWFANLVLMHAVFGTSSVWSGHAVAARMNVYEFYFTTGWCERSDPPRRLHTICLGALFGPLVPIIYFFTWTPEPKFFFLWRWMKKCVRGLRLPGTDKLRKWKVADLNFRKGASQAQIFRSLLNPSVFLIICNLPFALFHILIQSAFVIRTDPNYVSGLILVAILISYINVILPIFFVTPTPYWDWMFFTFFASSFDAIVCILTALVHPKYRDMNSQMGFIAWMWTYSSILSVLWIPFWARENAKRRFTQAAHVGGRYANLQSEFTRVMSTFGILVYAGLAIYRSFSWIIELDYSLNQHHFEPCGLFAKVLAWCNLSVYEPHYGHANLSSVDDHLLRLTIANLQLGRLADVSQREKATIAMQGEKELRILWDVANGKSPKLTAKWSSEMPNNVRHAVNPFHKSVTLIMNAIKTRSLASIQTIFARTAFVICIAFYLLTRLLGWYFFGFTLGSFVYGLAAQDMGSRLVVRDMTGIAFLLLQLVNLVGIIYFGRKAWNTLHSSSLLLPYLKTARIPVDNGAAVFQGLYSLYDLVVDENAKRVIVQEFVGVDLTTVIFSYFPLEVDALEGLLASEAF